MNITTKYNIGDKVKFNHLDTTRTDIICGIRTESSWWADRDEPESTILYEMRNDNMLPLYINELNIIKKLS